MNWESVSRFTKWLGIADVIVFTAAMGLLINEKPIRTALHKEAAAVTIGNVDEELRKAYEEKEYSYVSAILDEYVDYGERSSDKYALYYQASTIDKNFHTFNEYRLKTMEVVDSFSSIHDQEKLNEANKNLKQYISFTLSFGVSAYNGTTASEEIQVFPENREMYKERMHKVEDFYRGYLGMTDDELKEVLNGSHMYSSAADALAEKLVERGAWNNGQ